MTRYNISNTLSGVNLGTYEANDVAPSAPGEILVDPVEPLYLSLSMRTAETARRCVELIAESPICEGAEGIEFSADQLAGQWAADYAIDSDTKLSDIDEDTLDAYLDIVEEHCVEEDAAARFDKAGALAHALRIIEARRSGEELELAYL